MKYTVIMEKIAEDQLADIWIRATDQQTVTDASNRIERELGSDAHAKGNPRGMLRAYRDDPLEYLFHVNRGIAWCGSSGFGEQPDETLR